ncbi:response regulator [Micromonospora sp. NPDC005194]|uniref:response regulator n=1 Tax=Micromonospora sp. NPDC005194 TaxID=3156870 RepID=UPI0033ABA36C
MIVDDEKDLAEEFALILVEDLDDTLQIEVLDSFDEAEQRLETESYDLVVLDVRLKNLHGQDDEERGRRLYERVARVRWVPVVFRTAVPAIVSDLGQPPAISVVLKGETEEEIRVVREALASAIPTVTRLLGQIVDREVRSFLRDVVAQHWNEMGVRDHEELVLVLVNRLAAWMKEHAVAELSTKLQGKLGTSVGQASAAHVYLYPPVVDHLTCCDLLLENEEAYWLVLTPTCDLIPVEGGGGRLRSDLSTVRLARAHTVADSPVVADFRIGKIRKEKLAGALRGTRRYRFLPRYLDIPDLLVDFEQVHSLPIDAVQEWRRIATLDSPFAEAMLTAFSHSVGRVGTPDLETAAVFQALTADPAVIPAQPNPS